MKKLLLTSLMLVYSVSLLAQNTYPWPQGGNVGVNLGSTSATNTFQIGPNNQGWTQNDLLISNTNGGLAIHNTPDHTYLYGNLSIAIRPGWGKMAILAHATGNVGIQSINPQAPLQISDERPVLIKSNGGNGVYGSEIGFNALLDTQVVPNIFRKLGGTSQNGGASIAVDYTGNMMFQMFDANTEAESITNYSPQVVFRNNGNVGIGTTYPTKQLHVSGASDVEQWIEATGDGFSSLTLVSNNKRWHFSKRPGYEKDALQLFYHGGSVWSDPYLTVLPNGDVGIGSDPDSKLSVKGVIHSEEVKVDLTVRAPDYVFESDYELRPLGDVEAYVFSNKHLPEVPSGNEMEENGIKLKEMNLLLLKKIEELTLYVIQLNKDNEMLKHRIEKLESR